MSSLNINLPANAQHGNIQPHNFERADKEKLGLEAIGSSGIPFSVSFQGACSLLWPWLWSTTRKYDNIEVLSANFGHALASHIPDCLWEWEMEKGIRGELPIRFFPEYTQPRRHDFPEEFFLVTQGHYSLHSQKRADYLCSTNGFPAAVKHKGKIALLLKECLFGPFLESFKQFQANPLDAKLVQIMVDEVKKIGDSSKDEVVIVPLDPEAPYNGSDFGAIAVWTEFLEAIETNGLASVFTKLGPHLDTYRRIAQPGELPEKDLSKWVDYPEQHAWIKRMQEVQVSSSTRQKVLLSLALGSDILAAWWFERNPDARVIETVDRNGDKITIRVSFNPEIVRMIKLSAGSIGNGNTFKNMFKNLDEESLFIQRFMSIIDEIKI